MTPAIERARRALALSVYSATSTDGPVDLTVRLYMVVSAAERLLSELDEQDKRAAAALPVYDSMADLLADLDDCTECALDRVHAEYVARETLHHVVRGTFAADCGSLTGRWTTDPAAVTCPECQTAHPGADRPSIHARHVPTGDAVCGAARPIVATTVYGDITCETCRLMIGPLPGTEVHYRRPYGAACGRIAPAERITSDVASVTCPTCRAAVQSEA